MGVEIKVGGDAPGLREQLANGAIIFLGQEAYKSAAALMAEAQKAGYGGLIIPVEHASGLAPLPAVDAQFCLLNFLHFAPWKSASPAITQEIEDWKRKLVAGVNLGTPRPEIEFLLTMGSSETTLVAKWTSTVNSQQFIRVARELEESCLRNGGRV